MGARGPRTDTAALVRQLATEITMSQQTYADIVAASMPSPAEQAAAREAGKQAWELMERA